MKTSKIHEVLGEICQDAKVVELIKRVIEWERHMITSRTPQFREELDFIIEEVVRK